MHRAIQEFLKDWDFEAAATVRTLEALTDTSLAQRVAPKDRTLGRIAWHLVQTLPEMMGHAGLAVAGPAPDVGPPSSAGGIVEAYRAADAAFRKALSGAWTDAMLADDVNMYGQVWKRGTVLGALMAHQTHHRGQMTVLMRQAGLKPPGIYGPAREDWASMKMEPPAV